MKLVVSTAFLFALIGTALAGTGALDSSKVRFANAASDACIANCANENASCKRVCPTTLSAPCLNACDSQMQTCRQGCQNR
jgi:hypothetical protein